MVLCGYQIDVVAATPSVLDFARRLILSQTFEALSGRLSDARAELELLADQAATAAAPGGVGPVLQASADLRMNVTLVVSGVVSLVHGCVRLAATAASGSASPSSTEAASACYAQELAAALRASAVAEHTWVALASVLRLWALEHTAAAGPSAQPDALGLLPRDVDMAVGEMTKILRSISTFHLRTLPAALESAAVLGPCASYTALAHGIAVLSAMDGGGTHGLEPSVIRGVSALVRMEAEDRLSELYEDWGRGAGAYRCEETLDSLVAYLAWPEREKAMSAGTQPLLPRETALGLALRTARVGVQAAAEASAGRTEEEEVAALTAAQQGSGCCRVLLTWNGAAGLSLRALISLRSLIGGPDLGEEWWRLAAALAPQLQLPDALFAAHYGANVLAQAPRVAPSPAPLPPAPPLGLESALAGGVLPCLERLVRRAAASLLEGGPGENQPEMPRCHEAEALAAFIKTTPGGWPRLAPLLAWGDARQAAALGLAAARQGRGAGPGGGGGGAGALSPAERQLLEMLAAAAAAWLPPLIGDVVGRAMRGTINEALLAACLRTLPLLACVDLTSRAPWATLAAAGAGGLGGGGTGGAGASSGGGGAGWLAELCPMHLVGMVLSALTTMKIACPPHLAEACCTVAAAIPEDVMRIGDTEVSWSPQQLRSLGAELRNRGDAAAAEAAEALAAQLVRWAHGSGPRGGRGGARASAASGAHALAARFGAWFPGLEAAAALLPASPAAARACLGGCSNPACANLEGDSDAALPLRACAGCGGAASYCSRECQTAHWQSGHREACRGGAGGGGGGSGARRSG
ncbi:hypothetical protein HYH03_018938 [Edaphochlamys debaryana]|uniref:MYND-type domain-containing protein n=1 Tax=Edaphochlamys debaryana TaxID=47281 RepID=A0A835XEY3_9CHLO|nr:hypothetical protein HYH03_018938 [Edaphochlamys debaryana]|eukprot:KAG2482114.1 hypothetical protein HYH03_018938 [Edaphochlamys debaryana]